MEPCFPVFGTDVFNLRILDGIEAAHVGNQIFSFSQKVSRAGFDFLSDLFRMVIFCYLPGPAEQIHEGKVGNVLGVGIAKAFTPLHFFRVYGCLEVFNKTALAHSRVTDNGKDRPFALLEIGNCFLQLGHLHFSTDQICS